MTDEPYVRALFVTIVVDGLARWPWLGTHWPVAKSATAFLGCNRLTHGLLQSLLSAIPVAYLPSVLFAQTATVLSQAVGIRIVVLPRIRTALALSLGANTTSTLVGLALQHR